MISHRSPPNFFVIGAQKAGTTTLHDRLAKCNLVNLPDTKETHFFSNNENYRRGLDWYFKQFPSSNTFVKRGEVAPDYLFSEQAPARIKSLTLNPDILCIFRNPIDRAYSHYLMAVRNGYEQLSFHDALLAEQERLSGNDPRNRALYGYLGRSLYAKQLTHYLDVLPDARYFFLKFEDFTDDGPIGLYTYQKICGFIGVSGCAHTADISLKSNVASRPRSGLLRNLLYSPSAIKRILRLLIPTYDLRARIAHRLDKLNQRPITKQPIGQVPSEIIDHLLNDLDLLQTLTNLDLTSWKDGISALYRRE